MSKAVDPVSVEVYHRVIRGKKDICQDKQVIAAMREFQQPCTSRELHSHMLKTNRKMELQAVRRCLTDMSSAKKYGRPWVVKAAKRKCTISGEPVNTWELYNNQLNLFQ
jgi:hypothetical protein